MEGKLPEQMMEGQPFAPSYIGNHIYYHECLGYYDYLERWQDLGSGKCQNCGKDNAYSTERSEGDYYRIVSYCPDCKVAYEFHQLICTCGKWDFQHISLRKNDDTVACLNCGSKADTMLDMVFQCIS